MFSLDAYWTLRNAAAIVRRSDRAVLVVTGRDRATWLQGLLTNDVLVLQEGQSCYAAYLTPQGRMITDMHVIALADRVWLDVPAPLAASLKDRLDGLIFAEDAQVSDASGAIAVWAVIGPQVEAGLPPSLKASADRHSLGDGGQTRLETPARLKTRLYNDSSFGVSAFTLYLDASELLPSALRELPEANLETLDVLRIEAGTPKFLVDMTEDTIPLEAGIEDRAISFTKGCYVGQEVIVRVTHRGGGRVAKRLVRWRVAGPASTSQHLPAPAALPGSRILSGNRDIGRVTSAAFSPVQDALIGLGYVHRDFIAPGTTIAVHAGEGWVDAEVI